MSDEIIDAAIELAARKEAEWDGRTFEAMGRENRQRYKDRFRAALEVYQKTRAALSRAGTE